MELYSPNAQLAYDTIMQKPTDGIPIGLFHLMEHSVIERLANSERGSYVKDPNGVYVRMLNNVGVNLVDQYLAENPLSMSDTGLENYEMGSTTGGECIVDGMKISSPEDAAQHMEEHLFPSLLKQIQDFDEQALILAIKKEMSEKEAYLGQDILACGYGHIEFPKLLYTLYGYENYFSCYALYPELMEKLFSLQADYSVKHNSAVIKAYKAFGYPLFMRLDHDMADGRGTLCSIKSLEKYWLDNFKRSIKPALDAGFRMIWHCDGNLMKLIPYLLECGIKGFQGFQYEDGMDYKKICEYKAYDGSDLIIMAGVSVTRTLPFGSPDDVAREIKFLVENGPKTGLFLSTSSTCVPGTPWENIKTMVEGMQYYKNRRS